MLDAMTTQDFPTLVYKNRALILDDNDANRMLLKVAMQMAGIDNAEAGDGKSALNMWNPGAFAFAFLDIELPDINGIEVARRIREQDNGIGIIMCSTNDNPETVSNAVAAGCDMFFVKPFRLDVLISFLKVINRTTLRSNTRVLIVDNTGLPRWEARAVRT